MFRLQRTLLSLEGLEKRFHLKPGCLESRAENDSKDGPRCRQQPSGAPINAVNLCQGETHPPPSIALCLSGKVPSQFTCVYKGRECTADRRTKGHCQRRGKMGRNYKPGDLAQEKETPTPPSSAFDPWILAVLVISYGIEKNCITSWKTLCYIPFWHP